MNKEASSDHPIHELIRKRWSPYGFDERSVSKQDIDALMEAARWAPSSYNEQPWSFIVATRDDGERFDQLLSCLVDANQAWAKAAPVLVLCCTRLKFSRNGKPNAAATHDLGLAAGNICFEATARGLSVHQMIGIHSDKAREVFEVPEDIQPLTAMAIGYAADPESLPEELKQRDQATRQRKPLSEFVFSGKWGHPAN
ncbi:nitroreductase family protein [Novipirellula caenicola]|uniref:Malonic semialdehyde reductase RutE n=1 Tax=Novipirellula caenicola TaxID=1536901 RepID=A0ABP9VYW9_9BACT